MKIQTIAKFTAQLLWWAAYLFAGAGILTHWVAYSSIFTDIQPISKTNLDFSLDGSLEPGASPGLENSGVEFGVPAIVIEQRIFGSESSAVIRLSPTLSGSCSQNQCAFADTFPIDSSSAVNHSQLDIDKGSPKPRIYRWHRGLSISLNHNAYMQGLRFLNLSEKITLQDDFKGPGTYQIVDIQLMSDTALKQWVSEVQKDSKPIALQWLIVHSPYDTNSTDVRYVIVAKRTPLMRNTDAVRYHF
ncbi:hypothetical protein FE810_04840 [Thalassotalea litorea]|uniref:Uncharacterized protein n=1 Tax=Thalassotalea litorea TaxID=2020715 RepID=A0A5R9IUI7_9GAMM|nr:hypothetical protein [Thalassotalea litorea]TLU66836.1 hypothetical protein FE810_04840 [Thalassotalea litorea]